MPRSTLLCTGWRRVQETQCCVRECGGYNIWVYNAEATVSYIMPEFIESIEAYFCSYVPKSIMKFVRHEKTWHPHQRLRPNMALAWTKGVTTLLPGEAALTLRHASLVDSTVTSGEISSFHSGVPRLWQKRKKDCTVENWTRKHPTVLPALYSADFLIYSAQRHMQSLNLGTYAVHCTLSVQGTLWHTTV